MSNARYEVQFWTRGKLIRTEEFAREIDARRYYADRLRACVAHGVAIFDLVDRVNLEIYGALHIGEQDEEPSDYDMVQSARTLDAIIV